MKKYCCVCARQIVKRQTDTSNQAPTPVTMMGPNQYCCADCSKDLDENGLFPEERSAAYASYQR
jgi:hypothetical protein